MICALRAWHRRIVLLLALALPLLVFIGLAARREVPAMDELPVPPTSAPKADAPTPP